MPARRVKYKRGYRYQLVDEHSVPVDIPAEADSPFVKIHDGVLTMAAGYAWDGPSGPTLKTMTFVRGSLIHDALYQLMRLELLDASARAHADEILRETCLQDGMNRFRAWYVYIAVRLAGGPAANPKNARPVLVAPR